MAIEINSSNLEKYCANKEIVDVVQSSFKGMYRSGAVKLLKKLLKQTEYIYVDEIVKKNSFFISHNTKRLEQVEGKWFFSTIYNEEIKIKLYDVIKNYDKDFEFVENPKSTNGIIKLCKYSMYEDIRKLICDEDGQVGLSYDFNKHDLDVATIQNVDTLQRANIQIIGKGIKFDYPVKHRYVCSQCCNEMEKFAYETVSTQTKVKCNGYYTYTTLDGDTKTKQCNTVLYPDTERSVTKDGYFYEINYENSNKEKQTVSGISFNNYSPGFYNAVLFKIKNPGKTETLHIMDVKPIESNPLLLPEIINNENYVFTLQRSIDKYIEDQIGVRIAGLQVIKAAMIIQKVISEIGNKLIANVQIVGDRSTGKSLLLKYYGMFLYNSQFTSSNGLSISIPALRGTKYTVNLMGREQKIVTVGYLGTFKNIHIDEAGENKELVQNLKTFALEDTYSYDKAGSDGTTHVRTTHINLSENVDHQHITIYNNSIRKAYKDESFIIEGEKKLPWNESWDLHLPLHLYNDPYLYKVIKDKREDLYKNKLFWIDGYDYALHERFPFYFYLVHEGAMSKDILDAVKLNTIKESSIIDNINLIRMLKTDSINKYVDECKQYINSDSDYEAFNKVDDLLKEYSIDADTRMKKFYYTILRISRIINKRLDINEQDFNLLKLFLEKTNCKLSVNSASDINVKGVSTTQMKLTDEQIEDKTIKPNEGFGSIEDDFS